MSNKEGKKILFIVNPFAGVSQKGRFPSLVERKLGKSNIYYKIAFTEHAGHATELATNGVAEGADIIAAVGGDGTVNEVAKALVGTDTPLAIIPGGSGNGLSTHLGIGRNAGRALKILRDYSLKVIDTCKVNDEIFVNMAGTGMDAQVAHRTSQNHHRGFLNYFMDAMKISMAYRNEQFQVQTNEEIKEGKFLSVNIANGSMFGYNFVVAPHANVSDGHMQLVLMHHAPKWMYFMHSWRFFTKTIHRAPFAEILPVKSVKITGSNPIVYHKDGDGLATGVHELNAEVIPQSLKVVVPRNS